MISQYTKSVLKTSMNNVLSSAGIKASFGVYRDTMVLKIKKAKSEINFIENYNSNVCGYQKVSVIMTIEYFNAHRFSGEAKKVVDALFSIAKSYGCKLAIDVSDV